jgi:hypothetical protein
LTPNQQRLYIPVMASEEYKGFHVSAWPRPEYGKGSASVSIVCKPKPNGVNRQGGFICFAILPTLLRFSPSLWLALIFLLSLAGVAAAQGSTSLGIGALQNNTTGQFSTASGVDALFGSVTGNSNTNRTCALWQYGRLHTASGVRSLATDLATPGQRGLCAF